MRIQIIDVNDDGPPSTLYDMSISPKQLQVRDAAFLKMCLMKTSHFSLHKKSAMPPNLDAPALDVDVGPHDRRFFIGLEPEPELPCSAPETSSSSSDSKSASERASCSCAWTGSGC